MDPLFEEKGDWKFIGRHPLSAEYENMTGEPWQDFLDNLKQVGIVNNRKIVLYQGQVLDGWQLYRGCLALNIEPQFRELPQGFDPEQYVKIANDLRRKEESAESVQQRAVNRRARVAAARANGQSTRSIAATENVSQQTILRDLSTIQESPSGDTPYQLETEQTQPVTSDGNHFSNAVDANGHLLPVPENGKVVGQDGKQYPSVKPTPVVRCTRCQRCIRVGQPLPKNCGMCKELQPQKPSKPRQSKPDTAPAPVDAFGTEIPKRCRDAYCDPWIQSAIDFLGVQLTEFLQERLADGMNSRKKHYPFLNAKDFIDGCGFISNYVEQLLDHLKDNRPAGVCPSCGNGEGCGWCKMSGLVPRKEYAELKENHNANAQAIPT